MNQRTGLLLLIFMIFSMAILFISKPIYAQNPSFSRIILLGDSLTDTGKMYQKSLGVIPAAHPPFQFRTTLYYNGRFSNGPVWIDYLKNDYNMNDAQVINEAEGGATLYSNESKID